ncbi:hypothetical protein Pcinc_009625 [Petrolisthes cinctipes]|uniref:Uncharacterized protein n=1 Tax=Petrolisthes cinctipes TaxID=88211 RepID=A0AAE1KUL3_PETCI|nr:hypothetical protein Pcinc_009625 [Petrolisthes cinctipes]
MALPTPPLQDMPGHMALPTPSQQDTDEYYTDELEMNCLLINNLKIQLYLTHLLNIDQQQNNKRGKKAVGGLLGRGLHRGNSMATTTNFCHTSKNMTLIPTDITCGSTMPSSTKYCSELHLE